MPSKDNRGVLIVEPPSQVRFSGPFTKPVVTTVTLINPTDFKIIFKIKTTAPTFYGVRPNFGVVQPRNFTEVEIARQPFNYDQNEKINHKFMVQSLTVPTNVEDLNKVWENADSSQLNATKLRCVFEMPTKNQQTILGSQAVATAKRSTQASTHALITARPPTPEILTIESTPQMPPKTILKNTSPLLTSAQEKPEKQSQAVQSSLQSIQTFETTSNIQSSQPPLQPSQPNTIPRFQLPAAPAPVQRETNDTFSKHQLDTLNKEMRQLHTENSVLRKENTMLKDEIEQMRSMPVRREITVPHSTMLDSQDPANPVPFLYVLTSVSIAVFSIFLGKYVL